MYTYMYICKICKRVCGCECVYVYACVYRKREYYIMGTDVALGDYKPHMQIRVDFYNWGNDNCFPKS